MLTARERMSAATRALGVAVAALALGAGLVASGALAPADATSPGTDTVLVTDGITFADALTTGPVASLTAAPILLVAPDTIPDETLVELARLRPQRIVVVGGPAAVSEGVAATLAQFTRPRGNVTRIAGPNRFATAAALSGELPDGIDADTLAGRADDTLLDTGAADDLLPADALIPVEELEVVTVTAQLDGPDVRVGSHGPASLWLRCTSDGDEVVAEVFARSATGDWYDPQNQSSAVAAPNIDPASAGHDAQRTLVTRAPAGQPRIATHVAGVRDGTSVIASLDGHAHRLSMQLESTTISFGLGPDCALQTVLWRSQLSGTTPGYRELPPGTA